MKFAYTVAAAALAAALLTGCGDGHKGEHCVRSHVEDVPIYIHSGTVLIPIDQYQKVCDQWAPNDPSTVTPRR